MLVLSLLSMTYVKILGINENSREDTLTIVTSFNPVYVAAKNVTEGVDHLELVNLAENQTGCLHDYSMTTKDRKKLEHADVFIINGGGIEPFLEEILKEYPDLVIIDSSKGISFLPSQLEAGESNPHVWLNPTLYEQQVQNIAAGLISADPAHKKEYETNSDRYLNKIEKLLASMREKLQNPVNKDVVIFHDSFAYLADALGLLVAYTVELEADTTFSGQEKADMIDLIRKKKVRVLFSEEQYSAEIPQGIARESGSKVYIINSLVTSDGDKNSYLKGMEENIRTLETALYQ